MTINLHLLLKYQIIMLNIFFIYYNYTINKKINNNYSKRIIKNKNI
jgi:hypothetical protein